MIKTRLKNRFKIHCLDTTQGLCSDAHNGVFYEDYDEALRKAKSYVSRPHNPAPGMVIYEAVHVILPVGSPIRVERVDANGDYPDE